MPSNNPDPPHGGCTKQSDTDSLVMFIIIVIIIVYSWYTVWANFCCKMTQLYIYRRPFLYSFPSQSMSQEIGYNSLCCTVGPCCLSSLVLFMTFILTSQHFSYPFNWFPVSCLGFFLRPKNAQYVLSKRNLKVIIILLWIDNKHKVLFNSLRQKLAERQMRIWEFWNKGMLKIRMLSQTQGWLTS